MPPSKCPKCKGVHCLVYTGLRDRNGNHLYKCSRCGTGRELVSAPTFYAYCELDGSVLEKDVFYTPCWDDRHRPRCGGFRPMAENPLRCERFKPTGVGGLEPRDRRKVEETMERTKLSVLEEARREKMRRLEED